MIYLVAFYLRLIGIAAAGFAGYLIGRRLERADHAKRSGRRLGIAALMSVAASCGGHSSSTPDISDPFEPPVVERRLHLSGVVVDETTGRIVGGTYR